MKAADLIHNTYRWKRELFREVIASFTQDLAHLNTKFKGCVNA
jgi:hypothetical protein